MYRHSASVRDAAARARAYCPSSVAGVCAVLLRRCRREIGKSEKASLSLSPPNEAAAVGNPVFPPETARRQFIGA